MSGAITTEREAMEKLEQAQAEYDRKQAVPVVGLLYSWPAWRRYRRAFKEWNATAGAHWRARAEGIPALKSDGRGK